MFGTVLVTAGTTSQTGGTGFTVTSQGTGQVGLAWLGGTTQTAYRLVRTGTTGETVLPAPAASATSTTDVLPPTLRSACYRLDALGAGGAVLGSSDLECVLTGVSSSNGPRNLSIKLNQSNVATLTWGAASGATGYAAVALGTSRVLPTSGLTVDDNTGGAATCYIVLALGGQSVVGFSDIVCGLPGAAHF